MLSLLLEQIWLVLEDKCILPSVSSPSQNRRKELVLVITSQVSYWLWPIREQILFLVPETKKYFFSDPFQWSLFKAMKYYPTLHTLMWQRKQRVANISFYPFPRRGGGGDGNILTPQVIYGKSNQGEREGKYSILLK